MWGASENLACHIFAVHLRLTAPAGSTLWSTCKSGTMPVSIAFLCTLSCLVALSFAARVRSSSGAQSLSLFRGDSIFQNRSNTLTSPPVYPVQCFNPYSPKLKPTVMDDCDIVINEIILRYPDPMLSRSWGYSDTVDIDLRLVENQRWIYGSCVVFVRTPNKRDVDWFRIADVALTATSIVRECVVETKYPVGGTSDVGSMRDLFYVGVGGLTQLSLANGTVLSLL